MDAVWYQLLTGDGRRFIVRVDEKLSAFVELAIREEPDGIVITFPRGIVKIPCSDLTKADQQRFHCDLEKASSASAAEMLAVQQTNQEIEKSNKQQKEAEDQKTLENRLF